MSNAMTTIEFEYVIRGHWDARVSRLDGNRYETREDAVAALARVLPDTMTVCAVDDEVPAWLVYDSVDDMRADDDGAAANASSKIERRKVPSCEHARGLDLRWHRGRTGTRGYGAHVSGEIAARLICMGIDVLAETCEARAFDDLRDLLVYAGGGDHERGLREVLRMLADAADSACDAHSDDEIGKSEVFDQMIEFAVMIRKAARKIAP